jgi:integrase
MIAASDPGKIGLRDRALVLLGFAGAFRRSELVGLDVADLEFSRDGLTVLLRRSKTAQDGGDAGGKLATRAGGVNLMVLLALSDAGHPAYEAKHAEAIA